MNVRGFDYSHYDDSTMRNGGYDAGFDPTYDYTKDEQEVKYFIDENFSNASRDITQQGEIVTTPSGWDVRNIGGSVNDQYFFYYALRFLP